MSDEPRYLCEVEVIRSADLHPEGYMAQHLAAEIGCQCVGIPVKIFMVLTHDQVESLVTDLEYQAKILSSLRNGPSAVAVKRIMDVHVIGDLEDLPWVVA